MSDNEITSIDSLVKKVKVHLASGNKFTPWFRGEPRDIPTPLLPGLFRKKGNGESHDENKLLQHFRMRAPYLSLPFVPPRGNVDQWLFLAQHVRLPTRLLDWTEGLLIALHFALYSEEPGAVVWMLHPDALNRMSIKEFKDGELTLTWYSPNRRPLKLEDLHHINRIVRKRGIYNLQKVTVEGLGNTNIHKAWTGKMGTIYPVAIFSTHIHPRMSAQSSRFTIHGNLEIPMSKMGLKSPILHKFTIADEAISDMKDELRMMGITHSSLFPELDGLSEELKEIF